MPNYCNYSMEISGKPADVDEFVKIIQADYKYKDGICNVERHLWRVFSADAYDEKISNGIKTTCVSGDCAWSVSSCMTGEGYQADYPDRNGTTLQEESKRLNLAIEVYSEEPGVGFMEHYLYIDGEEIYNECVDWNEYWPDDFDSVEEMNEECGTNFTLEEFESGDRLETGGFDWDFGVWKTANSTTLNIEEII